MSEVIISGYDGVFATRLRKLMEENHTTQKELASYTKITRQAISQYMDGSVLPNIEKFYKIMNFFEVSADYLLGISDVKSLDIENKAINEKLGLNDEAIDLLTFYNKRGLDYLSETLNTLIENEFPPKFFINDDEIANMEELLRNKESNEEIKELKKEIYDKRILFLKEENQWQENHIALLPSIRDYLNIDTNDENMIITKDGIFKEDDLNVDEITTTFSLMGLKEIVEQTLLMKITERIKYIKRFKNGFRYDLEDSIIWPPKEDYIEED